MAKKMQAVKRRPTGYDLMIERDSGNEVRILMGLTQRLNWQRLRDICNEVLVRLDHPNVEADDEKA